MEAFISNIFHYPTVFFTVVLAVMTLYWAVAALGLIELDVLDLDIDFDTDLDVEGLTGIAGLAAVKLARSLRRASALPKPIARPIDPSSSAITVTCNERPAISMTVGSSASSRRIACSTAWTKV